MVRRLRFIALAVVLSGSVARAEAAPTFVDETKRAFTLSMAMYSTFGPVVNPRTNEPDAVFRLGGRMSFQPTWFSTLSLDASFVLGTEGVTVATGVGGPPVPPVVGFGVLSPQVALRPPGGWVELAGGPSLVLRSPLIAGAVGRLSVLVPLRNVRFGPGVEVAYLSGDNLRITTVSGVLSFEFGLFSRRVKPAPED